MNTKDIKQIFVDKYKKGEFRYLYNGTVKTIEIQNAHFTCDKDWIIRKPNYDYASREIEWYRSQSLYVKDIPGKTPKIWEECADNEGKINSNYGWCIWSAENGAQYQHCLNTLVNDPCSRQAVMLYTRPSMQWEATKNGMHDFMCTFSTQCFLNSVYESNGEFVGYKLKYIVYMRSNDAVYGFDNDVVWHRFVQNKLACDLQESFKEKNNGIETFVHLSPIEWNAGSLHVYERHFKFLEESKPDLTFTPAVEKWMNERGLTEQDYNMIIANKDSVNFYKWPNANITAQQIQDLQTGVLQNILNK